MEGWENPALFSATPADSVDYCPVPLKIKNNGVWIVLDNRRTKGISLQVSDSTIFPMCCCCPRVGRGNSNIFGTRRRLVDDGRSANRIRIGADLDDSALCSAGR